MWKHHLPSYIVYWKVVENDGRGAQVPFHSIIGWFCEELQFHINTMFVQEEPIYPWILHPWTEGYTLLSTASVGFNMAYTWKNKTKHFRFPFKRPGVTFLCIAYYGIMRLREGLRETGSSGRFYLKGHFNAYRGHWQECAASAGFWKQQSCLSMVFSICRVSKKPSQTSNPHLYSGSVFASCPLKTQ